MTPVSVFCPDCATETAWEGDFCQSCGARLQMNAVHRVRGTAFLLNEVQAGRFDDLVTPPQRGQIFRRYAQELREMTAGKRPHGADWDAEGSGRDLDAELSTDPEPVTPQDELEAYIARAFSSSNRRAD